MLPPLVAFWSYPVLVAILYMRVSPIRALIVAVVFGYLFLPEKTGVSLVIYVGKVGLIALTNAAAILILLPKIKKESPELILSSWLPKSRLALILIAMLMLGTFGTVATNGDPLVFELNTIPGMPISSWPSLFVSTGIMLVPILLARRLLGHPEAHAQLLTILVFAGLAYSVLAIYEARFSPQLHIRLYGFFQHQWSQHVRDGGFRPIVFLQHGLWVSLFFSTTTLAALALFRGGETQRKFFYLCSAIWLLVTIIVTKSLGALMITIILAPIFFIGNTRMKLIVASSIALIAMTYPFLRGAGLVPIEQITSLAHSIDPNRALSLSTRLMNEEMLLEKTNQRPLFGWGTWGRNRVYDEYGFNKTITDGYWIIVISIRGWIGYIGTFGLLAIGIVGLALKARQYDISISTAGLAVLLAGNIVDLMPNGAMTLITWMMAGALLGRLEHGRISDTQETREPVLSSGPRYTRFSKPAAPAALAVDASHASKRIYSRYDR